mgnify:FL=1
MPYAVRWGIHTLSHSKTYYTSSNYDDERYMHHCNFLVTIGDHVEYVETIGFEPKTSLYNKIRKYLKLRGVEHEIELVGYRNPDEVKAWRKDTFFKNGLRSHKCQWEENGMQYPSYKTLLNEGSYFKYDDPDGNIWWITGDNSSGREANPLCTPIELLKRPEVTA